MAFRQIKAPALANAAITPTKVAPSAVSGQDAALVVNSLDTDTLLLHVASSETLSRITVRHLVNSLDTNDLAEGTGVDANLYFTDQRAKDAVADDIAAAVLTEKTRAMIAEGANATSITNETNRATLAEVANADSIAAEITRATAAEGSITTAYQLADTNLQTQINNILNNTDEVALNSLAEIVTAFSEADDVFTVSVQTNANSISTETSNRIAQDSVLNASISNTQSELDTSQAGAGLAASGAYVVGASTNYLTAATSLNDADVKLDAQMKTNADAIDALEASVSGLSGSSAADIAANAADIATNVSDIAAEISRATAAESALSSSLTGETTARGLADTAIRSEFAAADTAQTTALQTYADTAEADAVATADADATTKADAAEAAAIASAEAKDVARAVTSDAADAVLAGRATTLETEMDAAEGRLDVIEAQSGSATLGTVAQTLSGAINELHTDTNAVEVRVSTNETDIATNATAIGNILTNTDAVALNSLAELVTAYEAADTGLAGLITTNATAISDEEARALAAEAVLQANITAEAVTARAAELVLTNDLAAEAVTRAAADVTLQDNIDAIATNASGDTTAIQAELDATQTGAGLGIDGTYTAHATGDYISAATSLKDADIKLDVQMKANADAIAAEAVTARAAEGTNATNIATNVTNIATNVTNIAQEIVDRGIADVALQDNIDDVQAELDATQVGSGLAATGAYTQTASADYISAATSLNDADVKLDVALKTEASRAALAEGVNDAAITAEVTRAEAAEALIDTKVDNEVTRATAADVAHANDIATNATDIATNAASIVTNNARAVSAELVLTNDLAAEVTRAEAAEVVNAGAIAAEKIRAEAAESVLTTDVATNATAIAFINTNTDGAALDSLTEIVAAFTAADSSTLATVQSNTAAIAAEETRALAAEGLNTTAVGTERTRALLAEGVNTTAITAEETRALAAESALATRMTTEEGNVDTLQATMGVAVLSTDAQTVTAAINELDASSVSGLGNIQAELDTAEAAIVTNATAIVTEKNRAEAAELVLTNAVSGNDTQVRSDFAAADLLIQNELDASQSGAGLSSTGAYVAPTTSNHHDSAVSLADADMKLDAAIFAEKTRAVAAELVATNAIAAEAGTARAAEGVNATAISTEVTRATGVESGLATDIASNLTEITATQSGAGLSVTGAYVAPTTSNYHDTATSLASADMKLDAALKAEADRAIAAEGVLTTDISDEVTRATTAEGVNATAVVTERDRAVAAELVLTGNVTSVTNGLATELVDRAAADLNLQGQIDFITSNTDNVALDSLTELLAAFQSADSGLSTLITDNANDISDEETRATTAEGVNAAAVVTERTRAMGVESTNAAAVVTEETRALAAEVVLQSDIDTKVAKSGSTMSGVLNMGSNVISGLATPSAATDAASKSYVDGLISSSAISTTNTDSLAEGSTNLYFTDARAHAAISVVDTEGTGRVSYADGVVTVDTQKSFLELSDFAGSEVNYDTTANYIAVVNPEGTGMVLVDPTGLLVSDVQRQTLNGDDVTTTFAVTFEIGTAEDLMVFVGGVIQDPSSHYTVNSVAQTITFTAGAIPTGTQAVLVGHQTGYTVQAGAVTSEKLAADVKPFIQSGNVSATTGGDVIDTFDSSLYRSAKYVIQVSDSVSGEYETREALVVHDGSAAYITEFAMVYTGAALMGDASVAMNAGNVELTYTTSAVTASVKVISTYINI